MVARRPNGKVKVLNSPSDGRQRSVPNGLEVLYDPTATPPPATAAGPAAAAPPPTALPVARLPSRTR